MLSRLMITPSIEQLFLVAQIEMEQLMIPDRARSTIRGRLSELHKQGKVIKTFSKRTGLIYYKKVEEKNWNEPMGVKVSE